MYRERELTIAATISGLLNLILTFVVAFWAEGGLQIFGMIAFMMCVYVIILNILIIISREKDKQ